MYPLSPSWIYLNDALHLPFIKLNPHSDSTALDMRRKAKGGRKLLYLCK